MGKRVHSTFGSLELMLARKRYDKLDKLACDAFWTIGANVRVHEQAAADAFTKQLESYDFYKLAAIFESSNQGWIKSQIAQRMVEQRLLQMVVANNDRDELRSWLELARNHSAFFNVERFIKQKLS